MSRKRLETWAAVATIGSLVIGVIAYLYPSTRDPRQTDDPYSRPATQFVAPAVDRAFAVVETNNQHDLFGTNTKAYSRTLRADPGYLIKAYEWQESSSTRVSDFVINLTEGGRAIQIDFKLKSGPEGDRYRGWLKGKLVTHQVPADLM